MIEKIVGRVRGPGETPHNFVFVTPLVSQIKFGEFVYYEIEVDGALRKVLARVVSQEPLRQVPDALFADPSVNPADVAQMQGVEEVTGYELYKVEAQTLGYHDPTMGFVNPRLLPPSTSPVYHASAEMLMEALYKKQPGAIGSATIGSLLNRPPEEVPVVIDVAAVANTHLAIIASTGAGKSYLAGVLIEELMKPENCASIVVIDPHGEASTLQEIANLQDYWVPKGNGSIYMPHVRVVPVGGFMTRIGTIEMGDLYHLLPGLSDRMRSVLYDAYNQAQRRSRERYGGDPERWTLGELKEILREKQEEGDPSAGALIWRLNRTLGNPRLFDNTRHSDLSEICQPGLCSVLRLSQDGDGGRISEGEQQLAVAALLRRIFAARMIGGLDYPVFVIVEEAHIFAPFGSDASSKSILKKIMGEGRKFGVGITLISQRPGKIDGDVLSMCNTQFLMRIVSPNDQQHVAQSVESVGRDLLAELPALTPGQAIIAGSALNTPVLARVRKRDTLHGGASGNAPVAWREKFFGKRAEANRGQGSRSLPPPSVSQDRLDPFGGA